MAGDLKGLKRIIGETGILIHA